MFCLKMKRPKSLALIPDPVSKPKARRNAKIISFNYYYASFINWYSCIIGCCDSPCTETEMHPYSTCTVASSTGITISICRKKPKYILVWGSVFVGSWVPTYPVFILHYVVFKLSQIKTSLCLKLQFKLHLLYLFWGWGGKGRGLGWGCSPPHPPINPPLGPDTMIYR